MAALPHPVSVAVNEHCAEDDAETDLRAEAQISAGQTMIGTRRPNFHRT
jgi:hypothetical protein